MGHFSIQRTLGRTVSWPVRLKLRGFVAIDVPAAKSEPVVCPPLQSLHPSSTRLGFIDGRFIKRYVYVLTYRLAPSGVLVSSRLCISGRPKRHRRHPRAPCFGGVALAGLEIGSGFTAPPASEVSSPFHSRGRARGQESTPDKSLSPLVRAAIEPPARTLQSCLITFAVDVSKGTELVVLDVETDGIYATCSFLRKAVLSRDSYALL